MRASGFSRNAFSSYVAAVMLAGCGGSQPPIGTAGPGVPGTLVPARAHKASGSYGELLYVGSEYYGVYVYSYPSLSFVQSFGDHEIGPTAMCTDPHGDIWVASGGQGILEYAHGGTNAIATLDTNADVRDCAYDPTTGDLAAVEIGGSCNLAVWQNHQGTPTQYNVTDFYANSGTYDGQGNLFLAGRMTYNDNRLRIVELPAGSSQFHNVVLNRQIDIPSEIRWIGSYFAVSAPNHRDQTLYNVRIVGSKANITKTIRFNHLEHLWRLQGRTLIASYKPDWHGLGSMVALWDYPRGGSPTNVMNVNGRYTQISAVVISPGSSR